MMLRKLREQGDLPVHMTNFGASFKKAREAKGISLDKIAQETRISTRFLAAIENEEFAVLPGGVFNRGFIRTFAERVGLDPDQAIADYERLSRAQEPSDVASSANANPSGGERHLYPIAIGILAIAIAIFYFVTRDSSKAPVVATTTPAPAAAPAPVVETPPPTPPTTPPETTSAASPVSIPVPEPPPAVTPQGLTLDIQAQERTWIKVTSDGNSVNPGEVLEPGTTRKFSAENELYLSVGNAAGLTLKINDMPLKPLGKSGQVRSVTFTRSNLKDFIG